MSYFVRKILCFLILSLIYFQSISQISGFQGKRIILKSDVSKLILEGGYDVEGEFVLSRHISLSLNHHFSNQIWKQSKRITPLDSLQFKKKMIGFTLKKYWNPAITAPKGFYYSFSMERGRMDLLKSEIIPVDEGNNIFFPFRQTIEIRQAVIKEFSLGFGYQWILKSRFSLDIGTSLDYTNVNLGSNWPEFRDYQKYVAGNAIHLDDNPGIGILFPFIPTLDGREMGISIRLSLGILLF
ncbi:MAG: DUF3575 domain-containing protein [Bacteroidota bacterium]